MQRSKEATYYTIEHCIECEKRFLSPYGDLDKCPKCSNKETKEIVQETISQLLDSPFLEGKKKPDFIKRWLK